MALSSIYSDTFGTSGTSQTVDASGQTGRTSAIVGDAFSYSTNTLEQSVTIQQT